MLSIQSHVVRGYVGNKSAVFSLQLLGMEVDIINSVHFSNHRGYPSFTGKHSGQNQLLQDAYTHLLTGYIGSVALLEAVVRVRKRLRDARTYEKNHHPFLYVCDPVLGDQGRLYVPTQLGKSVGASGLLSLSFSDD